MKKTIQIGETLRLYLAYQDPNTAEALDPSNFTAIATRPDGEEVEILYPSADFVRLGTGVYFIRVLAPIVGTYYYRVAAEYAAGDVDVREGKFDAE